MFTKGFRKEAWDGSKAPQIDPEKARLAMKGMNKPVGQQMSDGWANIKSELGFGGGGNTGKMNR